MNEPSEILQQIDPTVKLSVKDIVPGMRFWKIKTLHIIDQPGRKRWMCRCDCGKEWAVTASNLVRIKSCGCQPNFQKFWTLLTKIEPTGCLVWTKGKCHDGYGNVYAFGKNTGTHRVAWMLTHGPIPEGMKVLHHCDNPPCCNPDHLFLGTDMDNTVDKCSKGRQRGAVGGQNPAAKLDESKVRRIRELLITGQSARSIAIDFMVTGTTIGYIKKGKTWRHVK